MMQGIAIDDRGVHRIARPVLDDSGGTVLVLCAAG
jgi:hypothetical protein